MRKLSWFFCLVFLPAKSLFSQQFLVDSLEKMIPQTADPVQKADLLMGLSRALTFTHSGNAGAQQAEEALKWAKIARDEEAIAQALLIKSNSLVATDIEKRRQLVLQALEIARRAGAKSTEAMATYFNAEHYIYHRHDYKQGLQILQGALKKADERVADKHIGNIYKVMGIAYMTQGDSKQAIAQFEKALIYFDRVKSHPFIDPRLGRPSAMDADGGAMNKIQTLLYVAHLYQAGGQSQRAMRLFKNALHSARQMQARDLEAWALEELANVYSVQGEIVQAIAFYQSAIRIYQIRDAKTNLTLPLQQIAYLYYQTKDWDVAETYFKKSLENCLATGDSIPLVRIFSALGQVSLKQNRAGQAQDYYDRALEITLALNDSTGLPMVFSGLSEVREAEGDYVQAQSYLFQALALSQKFNDNRYSLQHLLGIAGNYRLMGKPDSAIHYANAARNLSQTYGSLTNRRVIELELSMAEEQKGDHAAALAHYKTFFQLHDSIFTADASLKLKEEQVRQNVEDYQRQKEQAEREAQLLSSRNRLFIALAAALLGILLVGGYLFLKLRQAQKKLTAQNRQLQQLNQTKDKFFGIIAHDIRSPMAALDSVAEQMEYYIETQSQDKLDLLVKRVDKTVKHLGGLLDNLLSWAMLQQGVIPYHPKPIRLGEVANHILEVFSANAHAKEIGLESLIPPDLEVYADPSALHAILRNLVSNAIKFTPARGTVSLNAEVEAENVFIIVNDTGTGISAEKLERLFSLNRQSQQGTAGEKGAGLGLLLVKEFVEMNRGRLQVNSQPDRGSQFIFTLPKAA